MKRSILSLVVLALLAAYASATTQHFAYVTNGECNCVQIINAITYQLTGNVINLPDNSYGLPSIALNPAGTRLYVSMYKNIDSKVMVVDTSNNVTLALIHLPIPTLYTPVALAVTPDGSQLYIAIDGTSNTSAGVLLVMRTSDNAFISNKQVGSGPEDVAFLPGGNRAYIPTYFCCATDVIRTSDQTFVHSVDFGGALVRAAATTWTATNQRVYVSDFTNDTVTVIDPLADSIVGTILLPHGLPNSASGIAVNPHGAFPNVYVLGVNWAEMYVIDSATNTIIPGRTVSVGATPWGITVQKDGAKVWVASTGSNVVYVIDASTSVVLATISLGGNRPFPYHIQVN